MLTPPKDVAENRLYRAWLLRRCEANKRVREFTVERCGHDLLFWINSFGWQFNPDKADEEVGPFVTFPFQDEVLLRTEHRWLTLRDDVVWEKSRKQGATWKALFLAAQKCLFKRRKTFIAISHSEKGVYQPADPNTLFWKVQFMLDHLPEWMTLGAERRRLTFDFPGTKSSIVGMATTERSGVGGRGPIIVDEFGLYRDDYAILGNTADVGPRLFISTHYGVGTAFYELCERPDIYKEVMHWTRHPEQNRGLYRSGIGTKGYEVLDTAYSFPEDYKFVKDGKPVGGPKDADGHYWTVGLRGPWYDKECSRRANSRDVASHLDIAPAQSQSEFFDSLLIRNLIDTVARDPVWEGTLRYNPESGVAEKLVEERDGPIKLWVPPADECAMRPGKYASGNDISNGEGQSNSVCVVGEATTGQKVMEFATASFPPKEYAAIVVALLRLFKDYEGQTPLLNWENQGPGSLFGKSVKALGYNRLYYAERIDLNRRVSYSDTPGFTNNPKSKRAILEAYLVALRDRAFVNRSKKALQECQQYRFADNKDAVEHPRDAGGPDPSGARSNHGDRVIADALCWRAMLRLGAGKAASPDAVPDGPRPIATLEGRMALHAARDRGGIDNHPTRRQDRGVRRVGRCR